MKYIRILITPLASSNSSLTTQTPQLQAINPVLQTHTPKINISVLYIVVYSFILLVIVIYVLLGLTVSSDRFGIVC
jgi:hypothetical protein